MNEEEFKQFLEASKYLDADQLQRLLQRLSDRFNQSAVIITNMPAKTLSELLGVCANIVARRTSD